MVNPDGYSFSFQDNKEWVKNRRDTGYLGCPGVDLTQNYEHRFGQQGTSNNPCEQNYRGPRAFSEPETLAHKYFFTGNIPFKAFLTMSERGPFIQYPWSYNGSVPYNYGELDRVGKQASEVRSNRKDSNLQQLHPTHLTYLFTLVRDWTVNEMCW